MSDTEFIYYTNLYSRYDCNCYVCS